MGKQRKEHPQDSIFANNPFLDGLFDWMDSPEGQQCIAVRDVLWDLLEDVQLDAKQRTLIWPDAEPLDLEQSIQRIQKEYPDFPRDEVEEFLLDWIDMGYDPENYSQAQLDELDSLTERWVADHLRKKKASKKQKRTRLKSDEFFPRFVFVSADHASSHATMSLPVRPEMLEKGMVPFRHRNGTPRHPLIFSRVTHNALLLRNSF